MIPQFIVLVFCLGEVIANFALHGRDKPDYYAHYNGLVKTFDVAAFLGVLYWGGFFDLLIRRLSGC
jgi:hypothetical protein